MSKLADSFYRIFYSYSYFIIWGNLYPNQNGTYKICWKLVTTFKIQLEAWRSLRGNDCNSHQLCSADNQLKEPIRAQSWVSWLKFQPTMGSQVFCRQLGVIMPQCDQINYLICNSWNHPIVCGGLSSHNTLIMKEYFISRDRV